MLENFFKVIDLPLQTKFLGLSRMELFCWPFYVIFHALHFVSIHIFFGSHEFGGV